MFLQNASATGPDPFTRSTARTTDAGQSPAPLPSPSRPADATATRSVAGSAPGLYGGTRRVASCDVEQQVRYLAEEPAKNAAFASVIGITADEVPGYLRALTPLQLRVDTRVTNHGFRGGSATSYQAVLQAGTAVLVDERGVPRVRCACGNPLKEPVAQRAPRTTGSAWRGYQPSQVVVVAPAVTVVKVFVVYDPEDDGWFARKPGDTGRQDTPTSPPPTPPSPSVSDLVTGSPSETSESPPAPVTSDSATSSSPASESPETATSPAAETTVTDQSSLDQSASLESPPTGDPATDSPQNSPQPPPDTAP